MSLLSSFGKKSKLNATLKQTEQARRSEGSVADSLFKGSYKGYAEVLLDDPIRADALYHWGFALLHHARTKTDGEAIKLYQDCIAKFSFCLLINPNYLGAALNGGVAYMELARLLGANVDDELYDLAKKHFDTANDIQKAVASYNVACIHALRGDEENCLKALKHARNHGSLPDVDDVLNDADLDNVKQQSWFVDFIEALNGNAEENDNETPAVAKPETVEPAAIEETAIEEIVAEPAAVEEAVIEETIAEPETVEPAAIEETAIEESIAESETVEPAAIEEAAIEETIAESEAVEPAVIEKTVIDENAFKAQAFTADVTEDAAVDEETAAEENTEEAAQETEQQTADKTQQPAHRHHHNKNRR